MSKRFVLLVAVSLLAASCATGGDPGPSSSTGVESDPAEPPTSADIVTVDRLFTRSTVVVGDVSLNVAVADTKEERARGLMFVTDMGDVDGMLFVFEDAAPRSFWMRNTRLPLDIVFFDAAGSPVGDYLMAPCPDSSTECPGYPSDAGAMFALETVAGVYDFAAETLDVSSVP